VVALPADGHFLSMPSVAPPLGLALVAGAAVQDSSRTPSADEAEEDEHRKFPRGAKP
jgi:hypothetical protein